MKYLICLVSFLAVYNIISIYILIDNQKRLPRVLAATKTNDEINLEKYFADKGKPKLKTDNQQTFSAILTETTTSTPSSHIGQQPPNPKPMTHKPSSTPSSNPQPTTYNSQLNIALLGDSMIDTLGPDLPHLTKILNARFPKIKFTLFNYGAGATDIDSGFFRLTNATTYLNKHRESLLSYKPDILVVESFAYNHWSNSQADLDRHWLTLAKIVDTVKSQSPGTKIILSSTIAPYCPTYTDGSANLPAERKYTECATVKKYLENAIKFANSQSLLLADVYQSSLMTNGEGNPKYINSTDHIHPSDAGKQLFSEKIVEAIERMIR